MILQVEDLWVGYDGSTVVQGLGFDVEEGEVVVLLGNNGAGKSTVLKTLSGLVRPRRGRIVFKGKDVTSWPPHRRTRLGLALVPEGRRVFHGLSVRENLAMGSFPLKERSSVSGQTDYVFTLFPVLKERANQPAGSLSGGEQQMLAIGRALMSRPSLLLLDEPSMGLAPLLVERVFESIIQINRQGTSILLVEQNARKGLEVAGRGHVLEAGRIVLGGTTNELRADDSVRKAYLGEE